jgi:Protein of unknown function (DUF3987)
MQRDGLMAAFRGILRRFDDHRDRLSHDTIGRGLDEIVKPYLSLLANVTPADLKPYARARSPLWSDGYFARFAFVVAPLTDYGSAHYPKGRLTYPAALVSGLKRWHDRLGVPEVRVVPVLDEKSKPSGRYRLAGGGLSETTYTLSDSVWEAYYRYDAGLRQLIGQAETQDLDGSYARFPMKALRIAGLLASMEDDAQQPRHTIGLHHWYRGRQIAERWRASLHRLVNQLADELPGESREQRIEQRIERSLRRHGAQSMRELHLKNDLSYAELNKAMQTLMSVGAVEVDPEQTRTTKYRLVNYSSNGHEP